MDNSHKKRALTTDTDSQICENQWLTGLFRYDIINVGCHNPSLFERDKQENNMNDNNFEATSIDLSEAIARKKRQSAGSGESAVRREPVRRESPHREPQHRENVKEHTSGKRRRKKKKSAAPAVIAVLFAVAILMGAGYLVGWSSSMGTFLKNTYIDDTDVSGMTPLQATTQLAGKYSAPEVKITTRSGNVVTLSMADFGYNVDITGPVKRLYEDQDHSKWFMSLFKESRLDINTDYSFDKSHFERVLRRTTWSTSDTADARIAYGDSGYYIIPEVYGDNVDLDLLVEYVEEEIGKGNFDIDISDADLYTEPRIKEADLKDELENIKAHFDFIITYDFDYAQEYLTGAEVYGWTNGGHEVDRRKAEAFVENLANKYDSFMTSRTFTTTDGRRIDISQGRYSAGQYGWWIDREKTVDRLLSHIEEGVSKTIDPVYVQLDTGYTYEGFEKDRSAEGDIGSTYIEVDLSNQHLWYYEDGELKFETASIVSGKATDPSRKTPPGLYSVYSKETNYTMVAPDNSYRAKCSYFMRCSFEGIGLHDLSRSAYGGDTYINNGSHGCINMKYSEVQTLYNMVERGTPVVMYY